VHVFRYILMGQGETFDFAAITLQTTIVSTAIAGLGGFLGAIAASAPMVGSLRLGRRESMVDLIPVFLMSAYVCKHAYDHYYIASIIYLLYINDGISTRWVTAIVLENFTRSYCL
jgi:hypothetical protein